MRFIFMLIDIATSQPSHPLLNRTMSARQKLVPFAFFAGLAVLSLLPLVASHDEHTREHNMGSSNKLKIDKFRITPHLSYEIKLHGFLLWASVGFLMPLSILLKRISNRDPSSTNPRIIFYTHAITQVFAVLVAAAGGVVSIKYFDNSFSNDHQIIGLVFYGCIWLQTLVSIFRPAKGSRGRNIWFMFHWLVGISASLLGVINVFTGLQAYHKRTLEDVRIWTMIFMIEVSLMLVVYLLQEKWHYIRKQGATLIWNETLQSTEQEAEVHKGTPSALVDENIGIRCL